MKRYKIKVSTGYSGCDKESEFDMPDNATEQEVHEAALDTLFELIDWGYDEGEVIEDEGEIDELG